MSAAATSPEREPTAGEARIAAAFAGAAGRAALMPYLMGGFPDVPASLEVGRACAANGADLVELGVPYSDPLADGPTIHAAGAAALRAGATIEGVLGVAEGLAGELSVVLMVYANVVLRHGVEAFAARAAGAGISGLIVPDLPLEEAADARAAAEGAGLALVPLVAPTTAPDRMARIGADARGFLYAVSVTGTTGERTTMHDRFGEVVAQAKAATDVPVALGFGISTPEHAVQAAEAGADGVIVGTRLVRAADEGGAVAVGEVVGAMSRALRDA